MRIALLAGRYKPTDRGHLPRVARLLEDWGATVEWIHVAGDGLIDVAEVRIEHDLYVLKDKSDLAMSFAASLHAVGAAILNPYPVSAMLRDKIVTFQVLQAAGLPVPQSFIASEVEQLRAALHEGPLIVKPYRGSRGLGVRVVQNAADLAALPPLEEPVFAQRYYAPDGRDRKLYVIGEETYGVKRVWPPRTHEEKLGEHFTPSPELVDLARRAGGAFGIDLCGVDVIVSGGTPYVVDMSSLPGFKGVADAEQRLAEYIRAAAQRALVGQAVVPGDVPAVTALSGAARRGGSALHLVMRALSATPATPEELEQVRRLLDEKKQRA
jgi:ribosomal protein S6--L-glutamate ligase